MKATKLGSARKVYVAAVAAIFGAGLASADSVAYFYGATPTLMSTAADTSSLGSHNVNFLSQPSASPYQAIWGSDASSRFATVSYVGAGTTYPSYAIPTASSSASSASPAASGTFSLGGMHFSGVSYGAVTTSTGNSYSGISFTGIPIATSFSSGSSTATSSPFATVSYGLSGYSLGSVKPYMVDFDHIVAARKAQMLTNLASVNVKPPSMPGVAVNIYNPEPGGVALVVGGLGVLFLLRRRLAR